MSLDLLLGYRGIPSMGHAAFFGIGAYTAGFLGKFGWTEPISGLVLASLVAGLVGWLTGRVIQRVSGIALLMVTLGLNLILYDIVHRQTELTGGDDGLQGIVIAPVLGLFRFDIYGRTAYLYALAVTFLLFLVARALVKSPFGLALLGARENPRRMIMLGTPIERDVSTVFAIASAMAGAAGALLTQTTAVRIARNFVVPALGRRAGDPDHRRHRTALWRVHRRDRVSASARLARRAQPGLLVFLDRVSAGHRGCVLSEGDRAVGRDAGAAPAPAMTDAAAHQPVLETRDLHMAFGGLVVFENLNFSLRRGERHAIIGPNGAGKTTFVSLVTGLLRPTGATCCSTAP